jgi:hypothetical protein
VVGCTTGKSAADRAVPNVTASQILSVCPKRAYTVGSLPDWRPSCLLAMVTTLVRVVKDIPGRVPVKHLSATVPVKVADFTIKEYDA